MHGYSDAALVLVGDELLSGRTRDLNLRNAARILDRYGIAVTECRTVPDTAGAVASALVSLASPGRILITTGGLGPTDDDLTLRGVAAAASVRLERNPDAEWMIRGRYESGSLDMPQSALVQADIPEGAEPVDNPVGIAPGVILKSRGMLFVSLPGVPSEAEALLPACLERAGLAPGETGREFVLRTWGIPENRLYDMLTAEARGVSLAFLPSPGRVDVKIAGEGAAGFAARAEAVLGGAVYSVDRETGLEAAVGELLLRRGWRLSVAESCTGGMLGSAITSVPGSSDWFDGGVVSYSDRVKIRVLGVPEKVLEEHGAVSRETVTAMCRGVSALLGTEAAVAVSGIAGPGGGTEEKPAGTVWMAAKAGGEEDCRVQRFPGDRNGVREAAVAHSLGMLLGLLRGEPD